MMRFPFSVLASSALMFVIATGSATAAEKPETKSALTTATLSQREGMYEDADVILAQLVVQDPKSQRASLFYGLNLRYQERYDEAITELKRAVQLDPLSLDGQQATFILAKAQYLGGKAEDAQATIDKMKQLHPDSGWLPQAWVVEAQVNGGDVAAAEAKLQRQNDAEKVYKTIMDGRKTAGTTATVEAMQKLAHDNPGLPIELSAKESAANLLTKSDAVAAIEAFQQIVQQVEPYAPKSRISQQAMVRLAALNHRLNKRVEALEFYEESMGRDASSALKHRAALQASGIAFELLQRDVTAGKPVTTKQWEEVRELFSRAKEDGASTHTMVLADLMEVESLVWRGRFDEALTAGESFEQKYGDQAHLYRREVATAYVGLARAAKLSFRFSDAVKYSRRVLELYPTGDPWPKMDHVQRAYYTLVESLYSLGQDDEGDAKLHEFAARFPGCSYVIAIGSNKRAGIYKQGVK